MTKSIRFSLLGIAFAALAAALPATAGEADPADSKATPPSKSSTTRKQVQEQTKVAKKNKELECGGEADPAQAKAQTGTSNRSRAEVRAEAVKEARAGNIPCGEAQPTTDPKKTR